MNGLDMATSKAVQKRLLDLLSDRWTLLALLALISMILVSALQFGHSWLDWSADKYAAIFNSFSDNLAGRSMQSRLCQYVPIDVVYTWVNGSDPVFLDDLKHAQEKRKFIRSRRKLQGCPYSHCHPSHFLVLDRWLNPKSDWADLQGQNPELSKAKALQNPNLICGSHVENKSVIAFGNPDAAVSAADHAKVLQLGMNSINQTLAYWSSDWTVPNSFPMDNFVMLLNLPEKSTEAKVMSILPQSLTANVDNVWVFQENHTAIIEFNNQTLVDYFLKQYPALNVGSGVTLTPIRANLIISLPEYQDSESHQPNRFADHDQLRFSLRSLERFAPWVRHVYLVTNGQIPHWLNLDNPRLTLITHEEIFAHSEVLPSFSSAAIEANLHRIPGLADKFLYFNDDVMLGSEVWPEDFYSETHGTRIRWAWPLPDCNDHCPTSWVHDGYCDQSCNTTECMFDGGDCLGVSPRPGVADQVAHIDPKDDDNEGKPMCNLGCLNTWISDSYCDEPCDVAECGYDAGDCGVEQFKNLHQEILTEHNTFILPKGVTVVYWNVTPTFEEYQDVGLILPVEHEAIRSLSISNNHQLVTLVLYEDIKGAFIFTLHGKLDAYIKFEEIQVFFDTYNHTKMEEADQTVPTLPMDLEDTHDQSGSDLDKELFRNISLVDEDNLMLSHDDFQLMNILRQQLEEEEITAKGFHRRRFQILKSYVKQFLTNGGSWDELLTKKAAMRKLLGSENPVSEALPNQTKRTPMSREQRHQLKDSYAESLLYVNRLYNKEYGFVQRYAPAHVPHFIDKAALEGAINKFHEEWDKTGSRVFRDYEDMQFAFAFYHYLINEKKDFEAEDIFDEFDTDRSGTWSDREIRTLLTRVHQLPLYLETIKEFERKIEICGEEMPKKTKGVKPPPFERYYSSNLPTVTRDLIVSCQEVTKELKAFFSNRNRYRHVIAEEKDSVFKRLTSDLGYVINALDDIRKSPKKFICLNDDTDPTRAEDNAKVHAFMVDFFESFLPVPSSFELPPEYRNVYLHTKDMASINLYRKILSFILWTAIGIFVLTAISAVLGVDLVEVVRVRCLPHGGKQRSKDKFNI